MEGKIKEEVESCVREQGRQMNFEVQEINVQAGHVHLIAEIPPQVAVSEYMGRLKGKRAIRLFGTFRDLRQKCYWGNHFWPQGCCVGTVGLDQEMIWKHVKWQGKQGRVNISGRTKLQKTIYFLGILTGSLDELG
jgi:REP-associated tyrosine transposase